MLSEKFGADKIMKRLMILSGIHAEVTTPFIIKGRAEFTVSNGERRVWREDVLLLVQKARPLFPRNVQ